uniref:hemicentin-2-like isoform X3 n=1 Tax=Styela clava TaxID=7725 RepID=UPI001939C3B8|nr:hemicentin-2-like isoform X3 [Styela clava]
MENLFRIAVLLSMSCTILSVDIEIINKEEPVRWYEANSSTLTVCRWQHVDMENTTITRELVRWKGIMMESKDDPSNTFVYSGSPIPEERLSVITDFETMTSELRILNVKITDPTTFSCEVEVNQVVDDTDYHVAYYAIPEVTVEDGNMNTTVMPAAPPTSEETPTEAETDNYEYSDTYGSEYGNSDSTDTNSDGSESLPSDYMAQEAASNSTTVSSAPNITVFCSVVNSFPEPVVEFIVGKGTADSETFAPTTNNIVQDSTTKYFSGQAKLVIKPDKKYDGKKVSCRVTLPTQDEATVQWSPEESSPITVYHMNSKAELQVDKQNPSEGETVTLRCIADGNPQPELSLKPASGSEVSPGEFVFDSISRDDSGEYKCVATSPNPTDPTQTLENESESVYINVQYLDVPNLNQAGPLTLDKGAALSLTCQAAGNPSPSFIWKKNGKKVGDGSSFTIASVGYNDAATYACVASTGVTEPTEATVRVNVEGACTAVLTAPVISSSTVPGKHLVRLACTITGQPRCSVDIRSEDKLTATGTKTRVNDTYATLQYDALPTLSESTQFFCYASNSVGAQNVSFTIGDSTSACCQAPKTGGLGTGAIVGIIILVLVVIVGIPVACYLVRKRNAQPKKKTPSDAENADKEEKEGLNKDASSEDSASTGSLPPPPADMNDHRLDSAHELTTFSTNKEQKSPEKSS